MYLHVHTHTHLSSMNAYTHAHVTYVHTHTHECSIPVHAHTHVHTCTSHVQASRHPMLLLTGPPGCGKTATIHALSRDMQFSVLEWMNPLTDTTKPATTEGAVLCYDPVVFCCACSNACQHVSRIDIMVSGLPCERPPSNPTESGPSMLYTYPLCIHVRTRCEATYPIQSQCI